MIATLELPKEWQSSPILFAEQVLEGTGEMAGKLVVVGAVLRDGTNVVVLAAGSSRRWLRMGPPTGWKVEERFEGPPPSPATREVVTSTWRVLIDSTLAARGMAEGELGAP